LLGFGSTITNKNSSPETSRVYIMRQGETYEVYWRHENLSAPAKKTPSFREGMNWRTHYLNHLKFFLSPGRIL